VNKPATLKPNKDNQIGTEHSKVNLINVLSLLLLLSNANFKFYNIRIISPSSDLFSRQPEHDLNVNKYIRSFPLVGKNEINALVNTFSDPASKVEKQ
jgi:hypothetical protein